MEVEPASPSAPRPDGLIHPATASEFRRALDPVVHGLPAGLIRAFVDQGYCLHVIDTTGLHPLTLEVSDFDLRLLEGPEPLVEESPLHDGGAATQEELEEWLYYLQLLNPELDLSGSAEQPLSLPAFRYWYGRRLPSPTVAFLNDPAKLLEEEASGEVAGLVTHGLLPGLRVEANRILFWDFPFRKADPLLDWYVLHELGHTTDYSLAFRYPQHWRDWLQRLEQSFEEPGPWLTRYSSTSPHEYFAEGFAAWARLSPRSAPQAQLGSALASQRWVCHRSMLLEQDPQLYDLIEEAVSALLG